MQYSETGKTWGKLTLISDHARRDKSFKFSSLAHLLDVEYLRDCYLSLNRNKAVGIDGISWEVYGRELDTNLDKLVSRLKRRKYKPKPARRVYIPKNEKENRPLGIPTLENKIVERGITWILEGIYEQDFLECSYGFRPKKDCHQALRQLNNLIMSNPGNHVVESDIKGFFDNVDHDKLMDFIHMRIVDTALLDLIGKFLKAGYLDEGLLVRTDKGTPQGSILSPILANIFLHYVLDEWFESTVKHHVRGFCELIRYADDFVCVTQYADDAERIERALKNRFKKYGLEIHPTKSRRISFGRYEKDNARKQNRKPNTFDFLGFTHFCSKSRKGNFKLGRKTSRKKFAAKCKEMNTWLKTIRNTIKTKDWWKILEAKLRGHYQYYGVSDNYKSITKFYIKTIHMVRKWLNRRSQKRKMNGRNFNKYLEHYPLPKPRICYKLYVLSDER